MTDDVTEETPRERVSRRLLTLAAIEKLLAGAKTELRAEALQLFTRANQREPIDMPGGERLGDVRLDPVKGGWKVTDEGALMAWIVNQGHDDLLKERVVVTIDPEWVTKSLAQLAEFGSIIDPETGEVLPCPPGFGYVEASTKLVVTPSKTAPTAVSRLLGDTFTRELGA